MSLNNAYIHKSVVRWFWSPYDLYTLLEEMNIGYKFTFPDAVIDILHLAIYL